MTPSLEDNSKCQSKSELCNCIDLLTDALITADGLQFGSLTSFDLEESHDSLYDQLGVARNGVDALCHLVMCKDCLGSRKSAMLVLVLLTKIIHRFEKLSKAVSLSSNISITRPILITSSFIVSSQEELMAVFCGLIQTQL